jgi:WD40 repeat protein
MAPAIAAAAVIAIAVTLVAVRNARNAQPSVPPSPATIPGVPKYYVALNAVPNQRQIVVGNTFTGARLATISPPPHSAFVAVTGAADDRTFVVGAKSFPFSATRPDAEPRTWYLLRIAPGTDHPARLTRLRIPATPSGLYVAGLALSPDGSKFAVAVQPNTTFSSGPETLRIYSVATGALLGTWTGPTSDIIWDGPLAAGKDDNIYLSWLADGHTVAFDYGDPARSGAVRILDTSRPGHDLIADSRPIAGSSAFRNCSEPVVTSDGKTLACYAGGSAGFSEYSMATGKLTSTLYQPRRRLYGSVMWASSSGDTLIGYLTSALLPGDPKGAMVGVVTQGKFTRLSFPLTGGAPVPNGIAW